MSKILVIYWFQLFCLSANAADIVTLCKEFGDNVSLKCSAAECLHSIEGYVGMYLYKGVKESEKVFYYHSMPRTNDKITPEGRFIDRIGIKGPLRNHSITISNLTTDDAGVYRCVYIGISRKDVQCNVYVLSVGGRCICSTDKPYVEVVTHKVPPATGLPSAATGKRSAPLSSTIASACAISSLVTAIFILLILLMVKKCGSSKCWRPTKVSKTSEDLVYEVMTKNGFCPVVPPEQSPNSDVSV